LSPASSHSGFDRRAWLVAGTLLLSLEPALRAQTPPGRGTISGRVEVLREPAAPESRPSVASVGMPGPRDAPDRRRSVVFLESAPQGAFEEPELPHVVLDQRNQTFVPYVLAIPVGTTVDFQNSDSTYHNVFSLSKAKSFDLGRYARGSSRPVRFDRPGVVRVFCDIHSHMSAFVLVFAHRYFATTDAEGRYRIEAVPVGEYRLVVWNDGREREARTVRVAEGLVEADFVLK
jgi:plastocyanin